MALLISGHGPSDSNIMLVSDGGTDSDIRQGIAISGDQERELRAIAKSQNLYFDQFWKTCLIKERVNTKQPEANRELINDDYKRILLNEINEIKPNVIVPLSELAFEFITGLKGIRKFRGSILSPSQEHQLFRNNLRVIPTLGPSPYIYEDYKQRFVTRLDFGKIARNQNNIDEIKEIGEVWICETGSALRAFIDRHYNQSEFLVFDIETFANVPTCISFCFDGRESVCVPILDYVIPEDQRVAMLALVVQLLASPIPKVNQNIKFDWRKLNRIGIQVNNVVGDTMLAQNLLYCEFPKNLGFLTSIYTDMPYFKDEGKKEFNPAKYDRKKLYLYNAKDSLATHQIYQQQKEEIKELGVQTPYQLVMDIIPIYRQMEENGILIDDTQRKKLLNRYWTIYGLHCLFLNKLVGRPINPLSSVQVGKLVYDELQWKVVRGVKRTKLGNPSADEESLELLMWESECNSNLGRQILQTIIDCRKLHKPIEILELPTYPDGRHRCEFNLAGQVTGRTSAAETTDYYMVWDGKKLKLINLGHSFVTMGKHGFVVDGVEYGTDLRTIFVPSPGYSFVECDLSQAEARVDAVLAKDFDILRIFDGPIGIHRLTGSWVFDCDPLEIKKNILVDGEDRYHAAKTARHAFERNMGPDRLRMMIQKSIPECTKILKKMSDNQPNIKRVFHAEVEEAVCGPGHLLVAPNGRRREFFGRTMGADRKDAVNEGISQLPQAIVTDYLKEGIRKTITKETESWIRPLSEAHDGFLVEVLKGREEEYGSTFKRNVEAEIDFRPCTLSRDFMLKIPCEVEMSDTNWKEMRRLI